MLNDEQRRLVETSIWVVNTVLKKQGLEGNKDLKQDALLYMCKCAERFNEEKGVKWTTFAYKNVYLYIKRIHAKQVQKASYVVKQDLFDLGNTLNEPQAEPLYNEQRYKIGGIMAICTDKEKELLEAKLQGYTYPEIAIKMNCSASQINNAMKNIQNKARNMTL